jgi:competence protein ComEC
VLGKYFTNVFASPLKGACERDGLIALFGAVLLVLIARKLFAPRLFALTAGFVMLGAGLFSLQQSSYTDTPLARIASQKIADARVIGTISDVRESQSDYEWTIETDSVAIAPFKGGAAPVKGAETSSDFIPICGTLLVRLTKSNNSTNALPESGARLLLFTTLEPFRGATNPHEFSSDLKIQTQTHAEAQGYLHSRYDYYILDAPHPNMLARMNALFDAAHGATISLLDVAIRDTSARAFVKAVVLGERADMDKETLNDFTASGVAHILAVSGFNVAIISLVTAQLLRLLGIYWRRPRTIVTMLVVLLYSAIVGFQPSVVRAAIMIELYLFAQLLERMPDPTNILFGAAALNLIVRPSDLFDAGFQLSYLAVFGLLQIAPQLKRLFIAKPGPENTRQRWIKKLGNATAVSLGASIASYPVIATHFYRVSFIGLAANLPIIPLASLITALGFLLIPITFISTWLGQLYGDATAYCSKVLLLLTKWCAHLPVASHSAAAPSWIYIVFLICAVTYCIRAASRKIFAARIAASLGVYMLIAALHVPLTDSVIDRNPDTLQVLFFDVGQGDCILVHTPSDRSYMIDFGTISSEQNASRMIGHARAERTAIPFLRAENATDIEAGFISHMHRDHFGGALAMMQNCHIAKMFTSGERVPGPLSHALDETAREQHTDLRVLSRGDTVRLDTDITLYVLHPDSHVPSAMFTRYGAHIHDGMLAFKLVYRNTSFLFLGDLERNGEEEMLATYGNFLRSNVVKVAHHGSLTSSSHAFVATTNPEFAVISVGEHNLFGHPSSAIVRRWMDSHASVLRTDRDGSILLVSDGNTVRRESGLY